MSKKHVTFFVNQEEFAIPIDYVNYIELPAEITSIPQSPNHISGISTIRNNVVPLFDLKSYLFETETIIDKEEEHRIIGVQVKGHDIGVIVEEAKEIIDIKDDMVQDVISLNHNETHRVAQIDNRLVLLINPSDLMDNNMLASIKSVTN